MKTITKLNKILSTVSTQEEWNEINHIFVQHQRNWRKNVAHQAYLEQKNKWKVGDAVTFHSSRPDIGKCAGIITKRNPKRAKIHVYVGKVKGVWDVPYSMLQSATKDDITSISIGKLQA